MAAFGGDGANTQSMLTFKLALSTTFFMGVCLSISLGAAYCVVRPVTRGMPYAFAAAYGLLVAWMASFGGDWGLLWVHAAAFPFGDAINIVASVLFDALPPPVPMYGDMGAFLVLGSAWWYAIGLAVRSALVTSRHVDANS